MSELFAKKKARFCEVKIIEDQLFGLKFFELFLNFKCKLTKERVILIE